MSLILNPYRFRILAPLTWSQYEAGSVTNLTTTSTSFSNADATNLKVTFTAPLGGKVVAITNCTWLCPGGMGTSELRARWHDGTAAVADTDCTVASTNARYRHEMSTIVTGLTPGAAQTWTLQIRSNGTHAAGITVGPDYPVIFMVWDPDVSILPNHLAYLSRYANGGGATSDITSTTLVRQALQATGGGPDVFTDLPPFIAPGSGKVLITMHCTAVTNNTGATDYFGGLWDIDAAAAVAGSGCHLGGGVGSRRCHPHYRRVIIGLTPGQTYNWSYANYVSSGGTNVVGIKYDVDDTHEGALHLIVTGLDT